MFTQPPGNTGHWSDPPAKMKILVQKTETLYQIFINYNTAILTNLT